MTQNCNVLNNFDSFHSIYISFYVMTLYKFVFWDKYIFIKSIIPCQSGLWWLILLWKYESRIIFYFIIQIQNFLTYHITESLVCSAGRIEKEFILCSIFSKKLQNWIYVSSLMYIIIILRCVFVIFWGLWHILPKLFDKSQLEIIVIHLSLVCLLSGISHQQ